MLRDANNRVAVWIGFPPDRNSFDSFLDEQYDENGNSTSRFGEMFRLGWYDHDKRDAEYFGTLPVALDSLLKGASYSESFRREVVRRATEIGLTGGTAYIAVYDQTYEGEVARSPEGRWHYIGSFVYHR